MDIDGDGYPDLLSGSYPGEIYLFRGTADHSFAAPVMLKDKKGEIINKHAENASQGTKQSIGQASVISVADRDGDGVLDLIVGNINGDVYWLRNEGTARAYAFGEPQALTTTDGKAIHVSSGLGPASRAGPCVADWDADGDLDLLAGSDDGSVWLYRNAGSAKAPELAAGVRLVPSTRSLGPREYSKEAQRGSRSKICVADWNGDGRPDLLVGDFAQQRPDRPEPTPEELTRLDRIRRELEPLQKQYGALLQKLRGPSPVRTKEERDKVNQEMKQLGEKIQPLQSQLPREYENHGWVWLFLRK